MNESERSSTLVHLLQQRAMAEPDKLALRFLSKEEHNNETISYGELDRLSKRFALTLVDLGVGPGDVAEWLRQRPAKPCTRVRFPASPPRRHP